MNEETARNLIDSAIPIITSFGLRVIGALAILILGKIIASIVAKMVRGALKRMKADKALVGFFGHLSYYAVIAFAIIAALSKFGIETTSFVALMGAAGFAIGLALQGSLSNFAAGVLLLIFRPFRVDDFIEAAGHAGTVKEIGIFTTTMSGPDNRKIILPNSALTEGTIVNITGNDTRRVDMTAGIGYSDDIEKSRNVLLDILDKHPAVLSDPAPMVEVVELGDSSVNFVVRPWAKTEDYWDVYFSVMRSIKERFDEEKISIPFPQRDVHLFKTES